MEKSVPILTSKPILEQVWIPGIARGLIQENKSEWITGNIAIHCFLAPPV